tara:strand:- start:554 stop:724 length:171 start_codon:yes stop_codon:yes gene_type:complete
MILKIFGQEFVSSGHDIDSNQLEQVGDNPSLYDITNLIKNYDVYDTNYFFISRPLV